MELEDAESFMAGQDCCNVDRRTPMETPLCKNKEEEGSVRAWPVTAPMPKSDSS